MCWDVARAEQLLQRAWLHGEGTAEDRVEVCRSLLAPDYFGFSHIIMTSDETIEQYGRMEI